MSQLESNTKEKKSFSIKVSEFLVKFKVPIIVIFAVVVGGSIAFGVFTSVKENSTKKSLTEIENISYQLTQARTSLTGDELTTKENDLFTKASSIAESASETITKIRAYMVMAEIKFAAKDWAAARDSWLKAAELNTKSYTYGLCYYQAAICSEELNELDKAVEYMTIALKSPDFPVVQRSLFNVGRIEEQNGNFEAAQASYQELVSKYPSDQWASLAKTRLMQLSIDGKIN